MRTIKFRAWDVAGKQMIQLTDKLVLVYCDQEPKLTIGSQLHDDFFNYDVSDFILMQFTGLHDANEREIYEGDILKIQDATAKVVFWEKPPEFGLNFYHNEDAWCEDWNLSDDSERMEIIGNMYENPEILKD